MSKLHQFAWLSLILNLLGYVTDWGGFFSLLGFIATIFLYLQFERRNFVDKIVKLYIITSLLMTLSLFLAAAAYIIQVRTHVMSIGSISLLAVAYLVGLGVAFLTYKLSTKVRLIAEHCNSKAFRVASILFKISAYTMPLIVGILIQAIAQLAVLIAAIIYKPHLNQV